MRSHNASDTIAVQNPIRASPVAAPNAQGLNSRKAKRPKKHSIQAVIPFYLWPQRPGSIYVGVLSKSSENARVSSSLKNEVVDKSVKPHTAALCRIVVESFVVSVFRVEASVEYYKLIVSHSHSCGPVITPGETPECMPVWAFVIDCPVGVVPP